MSLKSTSPVTAKLSTTSLLSEKSANCETIYYDLSSLSIQCSKKERKNKIQCEETRRVLSNSIM